jgi:hypothetical protein
MSSRNLPRGISLASSQNNRIININIQIMIGVFRTKFKEE